ncbi:MAG TPA: cytochrome c [Bryobacteraceae bacterium]|nr:cytochrome c [Bryobacteraceae bacterium]
MFALSITSKRLLASSGPWILCAVCIGLAPLASPEDVIAVSGSDAIAARQASLDMSSLTFRSMRDAIKEGREAKSQGYPAAVLAKWARVLPRMFPPGTGQGETSVNSQARPAVWRDRPGFERAAANYVDVTTRLAALAAANDTPEFTRQLDAVDRACSLCHAGYKAGDQGPPKR